MGIGKKACPELLEGEMFSKYIQLFSINTQLQSRYFTVGHRKALQPRVGNKKINDQDVSFLFPCVG